MTDVDEVVKEMGDGIVAGGTGVLDLRTRFPVDIPH